MLTLEEITKKISFEIGHVNSVKPERQAEAVVAWLVAQNLLVYKHTFHDPEVPL